MEQFQSLLTIAGEAGCLPLIQQARQQAQALEDQKKLKIVVTGMRNTGKTTLINRMVGLEVWEAGRMDAEEKPLRVAFEPIEEDGKYNCLLAVNHEWYAEDAVLYELREDDILDENGLTEEMCDKDVVLFLISALAPFNSDEIRMLKALQPLHRQVIVSNLQYVRENERQKVLDYIAKMNASLSLPNVIVWEEDDPDIGRKVRNQLPAFTELTVLREAHAQAIRQTAEARLEKFLTESIKENRAQMQAQEELGSRKAQAAQKVQSDWRAIITTFRADGQNTVRKAAGDMDRMAGSIADALLKSGRAAGFDASWQDQLTENLSAQVRGIIGPRVDKLNRLMAEDLRRAASDAAFLKLPGYREEDFRMLESRMRLNFTVGRTGKQGDKDGIRMGFGGDSAGSTVQNKVDPGSSNNLQVLLGAGAAIGILAISPLPTFMSVIGSVAVGAGSLSYLNKQREEREDAVARELNSYCRKMLSVAESGLRDAAARCYQTAVDHMEKCAAATPAAKPEPMPYQERDRKLNELLSVLREQRG